MRGLIQKPQLTNVQGMEFEFGQPLAFNAIALEGHYATTQVDLQLEVDFLSSLTDDKIALVVLL